MARTRYLLDANCWMEVARARAHEQEVRDLLSAVPAARLFLTDFALHSVGVALQRHKTLEFFPLFIQQSRIGTLIEIVRLPLSEMSKLVDVCKSHRLDFDDAYQYVVAELNNLALVSLDTDFDRTPRGRLTPAAALQKFKDEQSQPQQEA
jgi:hypothetical protein